MTPYRDIRTQVQKRFREFPDAGVCVYYVYESGGFSSYVEQGETKIRFNYHATRTPVQMWNKNVLIIPIDQFPPTPEDLQKLLDVVQLMND